MATIFLLTVCTGVLHCLIELISWALFHETFVSHRHVFLHFMKSCIESSPETTFKTPNLKWGVLLDSRSGPVGGGANFQSQLLLKTFITLLYPWICYQKKYLPMCVCLWYSVTLQHPHKLIWHVRVAITTPSGDIMTNEDAHTVRYEGRTLSLTRSAQIESFRMSSAFISTQPCRLSRGSPASECHEIIYLSISITSSPSS